MDPVSQLSRPTATTNSTNDEKVSPNCLTESVVVLLNSNERNDDYIQEIQRQCEAKPRAFIVLSPIQFNYINGHQLLDALLAVDKWSAICLTSKRCVDAVLSALKSRPDSNVIDLWLKSDNKVFVVGIKSYEYLRSSLGWEAIGSLCGSSENLAKLMVNQFKDHLSSKPVLYPCSQSRSDYLPLILTDAGIEVKEIAVYQTIPNQHLEEKVIDLTNLLIDCSKNSNIIDLKLILIFFSPSGFHSFKPFLTQYINESEKLKDNLDIKYVAIGDTTGAAIRQSGLNVWFTSSKPNAQSLAQALSDNLELLTKTPLREKLESWLNKNMKIVMSDGRTLVGIFLCTDRDRNVILGSCVEYLKPNEDGIVEEPRLLGLAMIPGPHIVSIHVDKTHIPSPNWRPDSQIHS